MLLAVSQFSLQQQTGEYVITIPLKGLALFSTLYPGGTDKYSYNHFQNSQDFALSGGVTLNILIQSDHCHAVESIHLYINLFLQPFALVMKCFCSRKLDISKRVFFSQIVTEC